MSTVDKAAKFSIPLLLAGALTLGLTAPALATPPGIPSTATANSELASLTVATEGSMTGYSREQFPHWSTVSGACNTRETVLKRDGTNVVTDSSCAATSGRWSSPYDGATWSAASDVDIDHVVPLAEAWRSGASSWTTSRREQFANDLAGPQLIAVTDNVNQAKGDQDPGTWKPPLTSYWCTYAKMWVHTKYRWGLKLNSAEKTALQSMLGRC
ncbi:HNH endonuclease family protein [Actinosynnema sp. NPDC047251]|uniref:Secreted protein n=1 Tax=Saccharothrix espanaensis (strain ATCC 51144 / DSM 44229 / JCM 9112 / NBRC 15066 / NRRL 15764) TaxID=1179773 RepID=K0KD73_SACES|nr:HNH endonuclease family protein [Saccharothrix espanaensis]CCH35512.1 Secreted protein [Saccharothrix espanaensis DSM 44229]